MYVANVLYGCCKVDQNVAMMLQTSIPNVLFAFSDVCYKCVYLDVACFIHMLQVFYFGVMYVCNGFQVF
jgi:hypothetical protein